MHNYFLVTAPRYFVEILLFAREHQYEYTVIEEAIDRLKSICPGDISLDKIKALSMQKEQIHPRVKEAGYDPILDHANRQLREYNNLLN